MWVAGPKHLGHQLMLTQVSEQEAGSEAKQGWCCGIVDEAADCGAAILYGNWFKS